MNNTNAVNVGLTIASKSIPRSGHHLLKEILKAGFGERFAHCEWYFEPGCCRQVPCKFRDAYSKRGQLIHMSKSHDFNLEDEIPDAKANVVTLIGYRHPLWSLTSNFVYELRQSESRRLGVVGKMEYLHESAIVDALTQRCHDFLSGWGKPALGLWLAKQIAYQLKFFQKWLRVDSSQLTFDEATGFLNCPYEQINDRNNALLVVRLLAKKAGVSIADSAIIGMDFIRPSRGPWHCENAVVAEFLSRNKEQFVDAAIAIISEAGLSYNNQPDSLFGDAPSSGVRLSCAEVLSGVSSNSKVRAAASATQLLVEENMVLKRECIALKSLSKQQEQRVHALEKNWLLRVMRRLSRFMKGSSCSVQP